MEVQKVVEVEAVAVGAGAGDAMRIDLQHNRKQ